jgi:sugar O-acyltransferase (sialic acid O-acetyltransferase NeuD family)
MSATFRPLVMIGAGGHARVLAALAQAAGYSILGVCDPGLVANNVTRWEGLDVLGDDHALEQLTQDDVELMLGVGQLTAGCIREELYRIWRARGYAFPALVHPTAWVAPGVVLSDGVQIMAGAIIQPGCEIGENSIINTRASIDHDCRIGRNVHIAPGATLCGSVTVEIGSFIAAGATIIQGVCVGKNAVVGAGVTLTRDLKTNSTIISAANRLL